METLKNGRRQFLQNTFWAAGALLIAPNFISCSKDNLNETTINPLDYTNKNFDQGVASFDPTKSKVIIWTRYNTPGKTILWEVSTKSTFDTILRSGSIVTDASRDNTIAIELTELKENQKLYYRFSNKEDKALSVTGETITFPENSDVVKLAVCSCSNYQAGLFNVYNAMAKSEADVIVHLGDYFYEYQAGGYGSNAANAFLNRMHQPATEILSLEDYRTRYKQYRSDPDLQLAHQKKPFICVWDDHEIANDAYKEGAQNHSADEGDYETRKQNALKAYSEFLPFSRLEANNQTLIYRNFNLGNLVNLTMLDTRIIGRDKQLELGDYLTATGFNNTKYQADITNPSRALLGTTQRNWLNTIVNSSTAKWQVLGQQVLMARMHVPFEMLTSFGSSNLNSVLAELVKIKLRYAQKDPTLTPQEIARITTVLPYNLDAWDGYPVDREAMYTALGNKKIVTLAGDTHNAWSSKLTKQDKTEVGIELATSGITSPGFEVYLGSPSKETLTAFEGALTTLIDDLNYFDASRRGYILTTFTNANVKADWIFVDTILSTSYTTSVGHTVTYS
ncbi:alkaline phosphatase D family protein [Flavobacterium algicola]|uniref:alkaline phosphatase D family protein n=1 Tax=Flavobacterium algicola TaxID=556529 RepID=UPI001EFC7665|nr:alkaline phosphatase D family protein [Flavobacterium algicola]MCG9791341.1 alkaline phosphatase D family protein [Flavobacterium algicola]